MARFAKALRAIHLRPRCGIVAVALAGSCEHEMFTKTLFNIIFMVLPFRINDPVKISRFIRSLIVIPALFLLSFFVPWKSAVLAQNHPLADGTFLQAGLIASWNDDRWQQELKALKEVGMHYLIFAPTVYEDSNEGPKSNYPSSLPGVKQAGTADLIGNCLRNASKAGFKVFLGLNFNDRWWSGRFDVRWLYDQMETGNRIADELVKKYKEKYGDAMYGWYWVWEVDNMHANTDSLQDILAEILNINLDHLHSITPSMPVMLCPFMNFRVGTAAACQQMWTHVFSKTHFRQGDIFAPQDGVGAGGLELDMLPLWYSKLKTAVETKPGLLFWSDAETFDQRFWTSAALDRFVKQMDLVKPYVSNIISFAYSHYYSPYKENKAYHEAYLYYTRKGTLPAMRTPDPVTGLVVKTNRGRPALSWDAPKDHSHIAGFNIYRNGILTGNHQYDRQGQCKTSYTEKSTLKKGLYHYEVSAYTCTGVESGKKGVDWVSAGDELPGLDSYIIPVGRKGAIIAGVAATTKTQKPALKLLKDTSKIFQVDKNGFLRLKQDKQVLAAQGPFRYGLTLSIGKVPVNIELVKDEFAGNKIVAHRGAWKHQNASENSLSSLKNAMRAGYAGSEFDVWMSEDGELVISHDPVIGGKTIESTPAADIARIMLKNGDFVPTLKEYLDAAKTQNKTRLFLEIKSSGISQERTLALTEKVVRMVHESKVQAWVQYISFNYAALMRVKELDPAAVTAYLSGDKTMEQLKRDGISGADYPFYSFHSDTAMTRTAHRLGLMVNAWTVDTKEEMEYLLKQGVDLITTNEPEMLSALSIADNFNKR
jgi:glycerophosphoryl diester phosphodiesterase